MVENDCFGGATLPRSGRWGSSNYSRGKNLETLCHVIEGQGGSWEGGIEVLETYWGKLPEIDGSKQLIKRGIVLMG